MIFFDFAIIFNETLHITIFYFLLLFLLVLPFLFSKFNNLFKKFNNKQISKKDSLYKLNYIAILILVIIVIVSIIIIEFREELLKTFRSFLVFAGFSFLFLPVALGLLGFYSYTLKNEGYRLGNAILLMISFVCFGLFGSNLHDVIWCAKKTDFFQQVKIGYSDMEAYFNMFGIHNKELYDYGIFGFYMFLQVIIELTIGTITYYKYYTLNKEYINERNRAPFIMTYISLFITGALLGVIIFIFDYPRAFTDIEYVINLYIGIPIITLLFFLIGYYLGVKNKSLRDLENS